jgi:hypothetical protein
LDEHLPTVSVDLTQIQQVFINLISNAIEALEGCQSCPHIIVRASATDQNQMLIQVIDNGPGVADQERIFDAFVSRRAAIQSHGAIWALQQLIFLSGAALVGFGEVNLERIYRNSRGRFAKLLAGKHVKAFSGFEQHPRSLFQWIRLPRRSYSLSDTNTNQIFVSGV